MNLFKFILFYIKSFLQGSSLTLRHSGSYLKSLANTRLIFISDFIINSKFFLYGLFMWFSSKVGEFKTPTYLSNGAIKKRHFMEAVQITIFRSMYRKKQRRPTKVFKNASKLNYFSRLTLYPLALNKIFASVSIFTVYIALLFLCFKYLNSYLKRQTLNFVDTGIKKEKTLAKIIKIYYYTFAKILNTLHLIKIFITRRKIYKRVISLFSFIQL